jgi:sugar phosphate isomerase/epimerase
MRAGVAGMFPLDLSLVDEGVAQRIRQAGFTGVSAVLRDPEACTEEELVRVREVLAGAGVTVAHANPLYERLVDTDEEKRQAGVRALRYSCRCTRWLGSSITHVRPGSLNPRGHWLPYPGNTSPETIDRLIRSLRETASAAEEEGVVLALEGGVPSPLDTMERVRYVIEAVGSPAVRFNMDAANFVGSLDDAFDTTSFLHRIFDLLGEYTVCGHIKDTRVDEKLTLHISECAPGDGIMDLPTYLRRFEAACPDGFVLIEHLPDEEIPRAKRAVDAALAQAGLTWRE